MKFMFGFTLGLMAGGALAVGTLGGFVAGIIVSVPTADAEATATEEPPDAEEPDQPMVTLPPVVPDDYPGWERSDNPPGILHT